MHRCRLVPASTLLAALLVLVAAGPLTAQQVIQLKDQTIIRGKVLEMTNDTYRILTTSMGEVKIPASQVVSIVMEGAAPPAIREGAPAQRPGAAARPTAAPPARAQPQPVTPAPSRSDDLREQQQQVNTRVQSMMMDGNFLNKVTALQDSPEMVDVLNDPEVMQAIQSGDYQFLMNNEKMQRLMNSQDIKDILGDVE
ncbi:MAG: hypothetical protein OZSIB_3796 [Candidatus Ozemobacter sibiricus]|jgi:hypothetical protein|uniref:Uncharacterized protein n=1 Tax=Candidatus Ozemobacter sibiricus TaxID=2268124 RepID=A0A367ZQ22_9BACT|nr:MAG: hypothetical protein OZSIB_3796 [Candidatus Ozemobacter sibiricus]